MAIDEMSDHLLMQWAIHPDLVSDETARETFEERFQQLAFTEQYSIVAQLFGKRLEPEIQYWIMSLANQMVTQKNKTYVNSQFKSDTTMVEFFIRNYSYGETQSLRSSIWALMK